MDASQDYNEETAKDKSTTTTKEKDREQIKHILTEFGLDPRDYLFLSSPEQTTASTSPVVFSEYCPHTALSPTQSRPLIQSGRSLSYVQFPPPPPPVINRQASQTQSPNAMSQHLISPRRTPPPPPPPPRPPSRSLSNHHITDPNQNVDHYLRQINTLDNPPVKILKPNTQDLVYRKEIRIRYLQPPTPPPPAPIIIREKHLPPVPPESPLLIRERKPEPHTPPPLTIRERPPTPPRLLEPYVVDKPIPPLPPQPRQIIIERLPTPPPKPRTVIFEKWLPYKRLERPILLEKAPPVPPREPIRNVVIEYEPLKAYTVRRVIEEGVFRVDPKQYSTYHDQHLDGNVRIVDRIDDLPPPSEHLMRVLKNYDPHSTTHHNAHSSLNLSDITNVTRSNNTSVQRPERVLSPERHSAGLSPPIPPHIRTQSQNRTPSTVKSENTN